MAVNFRYDGGEAVATTTTNVVAYTCPADRKAWVSYLLTVDATAAGHKALLTKNGATVMELEHDGVTDGSQSSVNGIMFLDAGDTIGVKMNLGTLNTGYLIASVIEREGQAA